METFAENGTEIITLAKDEICVFANDFEEKKHYQNRHLIVKLSDTDLDSKDLTCFVSISKYHRKKNKKSLVIVGEELDYGLIPNEVSFAPTEEEAYDIIEMEEIERDLGI
ncbi:MAG: ribonuclease Z [Capnocytophaga sp.]|nr:ribonuclease Z [Capnocytophaga sp.]